MVTMRVLSMVVLLVLAVGGLGILGIGFIAFRDVLHHEGGAIAEIDAMIAILIGTVAFAGVSIVAAIERASQRSPQ